LSDRGLRNLRMTPVEAATLIELLRRQSTLATPAVRIPRSRDPEDDKFLECVLAGGTDYIVSAGADLLSLGEVEGIPIVDALAFWHALTLNERS
jgi:predicted nucleic acid-binding protein